MSVANDECPPAGASEPQAAHVRVRDNNNCRDISSVLFGLEELRREGCRGMLNERVDLEIIHDRKIKEKKKGGTFTYIPELLKKKRMKYEI